MKAAQYKEYGDANVIEVTEVEKPTPGEGQILIEVHASSVNPFDYKLRQGYMKDMIPLKLPVTIGGDLSGIVTQIGEGVSEFKSGDEVFGQALVISKGSGAVAEFATTDSAHLAKKPQKASFEEAGAMPLVASSAVQALEDHLNLQSDQKILIHGGGGGIGHIAIQLAKAIGAHVATTVGPDDIDFVKSLGADQIIDYKSQDFTQIIKDLDAVFDTVGGENTEKSLTVLKKGGILVTMAGQANEEKTKELGITFIHQSTHTNAEHLTRVAELFDAGKFKIHIDKIFPLDESREAFEYAEKSHPHGKVVIKIK